MKIEGVGNLCLWCMNDMGNSFCCPYCGHDERIPLRSEQVIPAGSVIGGHYLIGRPLGQGGFGITYLAYDWELHVKRAIKEYFPQGLVMRSGNMVRAARQSVQDLYRKGVDSFYREAQAIACFGGHPNVVQVHALFRENGTAYFVMDYVEGISFQQYLNNHGGKIPWEDALRILKPIGEALSVLHESHLLHRDVKPDNIFITLNGVPKLLDFGAARYEISECTHSSAAVLTPGYAPVEQYGSMSMQGTFTDVYALAATFYRAVSGVVPVPAPDRMDTDMLPSLDKVDSRIPADIGAALARAMSVRREKRTQTVAELLKELEASKKSKLPIWLTAAIPAVLLAFGLGLWMLRGRLNLPSIGVTESTDSETIGITESTDSDIPFVEMTEMPMVTAVKTADEPEVFSGQSTPVPTMPVQRVITDVQNAQIGDHVLFGQYEQDNELMNGAEAIEWRVLAREGNQLLLLSEYGLDSKTYNEEAETVDWEKSSMRSWLNNVFYQNAFSVSEQQKIVSRELDNSIDSEKSAQDKIFLLSIREANGYFSGNEERQCKATAYAAANGAYQCSDYEGAGWWWLRSTGYRDDYAAIVYSDGSVHDLGSSVSNINMVVRPAFWLNL